MAAIARKKHLIEAVGLEIRRIGIFPLRLLPAVPSHQQHDLIALFRRVDQFLDFAFDIGPRRPRGFTELGRFRFGKNDDRLRRELEMIDEEMANQIDVIGRAVEPLRRFQVVVFRAAD